MLSLLGAFIYLGRQLFPSETTSLYIRGTKHANVAKTVSNFQIILGMPGSRQLLEALTMHRF